MWIYTMIHDEPSLINLEHGAHIHFEGDLLIARFAAQTGGQELRLELMQVTNWDQAHIILRHLAHKLQALHLNDVRLPVVALPER